MQTILNQQVLSANGEYSFEPETPGRDCLVEWCITGGTATVRPGYVDLAGNFAPARGLDGEEASFGTEGGFCRLPVPNSGMIALKIEAAAGLEVSVCKTRCVP